MGSGGVAIAALPTVICLKVPFSDDLGGEEKRTGGYIFVSTHTLLSTSGAYAHFNPKNRWLGRFGFYVNGQGFTLFNAFRYGVTTKCSFRRMSDDEAPTSTSNSPGSTTRFIS